MVGKITLQDYRFNYGYKGFTSIINQMIVLAKIHYKNYGNYNVFVEDNQVLDIFENIYKPEESDIIYDLTPLFFDDFLAGKYDNDFNAHKIVEIEDLKTRNPINFLKLKPEHLNFFVTLQKNFFKNDKVLGIQIRGTDKITELPRIPEINILNHIDNAFKEDPSLTKIFIATDDIVYLNLVINNYGIENVIYNTLNLISHDGQPLHTTNNRQKINLEVMSDVYLLSKCDYILYSFSNVSFLALSMIENHNKKLININV